MSGANGPTPAGGGDEPGRDARLRAALDHAPDGELRPPPAVRAAVLQAAHGAQRLAEPAKAPVRGWRRWWAAAMAPRTLATAASVACVGIALKLAWPEPEWMGEVAEVRPAAVEPVAPREGAAVAPPAPTQQTAPAAPAARRSADAPAEAVATPVTPPGERAREAKAAPVRREAVPAPTPPPAVETTTQPPPAPAVAAAPTAAPPTAAPTADMAPPPAADQRAAKALAADAHESARRGLSGVTASSLARPAAPGHPAALARWAQALAVVDEGPNPPAGWQLQRDGVAPPWGPPQRAWWQALLAGTAGRWVLDAGAPVAGDAWQLRAPDGTSFTLRVGADALWLVSDSGSWRALRPAGLPAAP